ncbi:MAG: hypothetical protein V1843_00175, partial [bacterium]
REAIELLWPIIEDFGSGEIGVREVCDRLRYPISDVKAFPTLANYIQKMSRGEKYTEQVAFVSDFLMSVMLHIYVDALWPYHNWFHVKDNGVILPDMLLEHGRVESLLERMRTKGEIVGAGLFENTDGSLGAILDYLVKESQNSHHLLDVDEEDILLFQNALKIEREKLVKAYPMMKFLKKSLGKEEAVGSNEMRKSIEQTGKRIEQIDMMIQYGAKFDWFKQITHLKEIGASLVYIMSRNILLKHARRQDQIDAIIKAAREFRQKMGSNDIKVVLHQSEKGPAANEVFIPIEDPWIYSFELNGDISEKALKDFLELTLYKEGKLSDITETVKQEWWSKMSRVTLPFSFAINYPRIALMFEGDYHRTLKEEDGLVVRSPADEITTRLKSMLGQRSFLTKESLNTLADAFGEMVQALHGVDVPVTKLGYILLNYFEKPRAVRKFIKRFTFPQYNITEAVRDPIYRFFNMFRLGWLYRRIDRSIFDRILALKYLSYFRLKYVPSELRKQAHDIAEILESNHRNKEEYDRYDRNVAMGKYIHGISFAAEYPTGYFRRLSYKYNLRRLVLAMLMSGDKGKFGGTSFFSLFGWWERVVDQIIVPYELYSNGNLVRFLRTKKIKVNIDPDVLKKVMVEQLRTKKGMNDSRSEAVIRAISDLTAVLSEVPLNTEKKGVIEEFQLDKSGLEFAFFNLILKPGNKIAEMLAIRKK